METPPPSRAPRFFLPSIAAFVLVAAVGMFAWQRLSQSPPTLPQDVDTPPATPAPELDATAPALFEPWLRHEAESVRDNALARNSYMDAMLGHLVFQAPPGGVPSHVAQAMLLEDDELLLSSGRRLWNRELQHLPGMVGKFCYVHSTWCLSKLFETQFFVDGRPQVLYSNQYRITRFPSHTLVQYVFPEVEIEERKFITFDDRAVAHYTLRSRDQKAHRVAVEISAPYQPVPGTSGPTLFPLVGAGSFQGADVFLYLDAPNFSRSDAAAIHLSDVMDLGADGKPGWSQVAFSFENRRREDSFPPLPKDLFEQHQRDYNRWFVDNVPYFDSSDPAFKKMWYYRWWVVRFNLNQVDTPDLRGYSFYEGKLGFDNVISFAVPVQLKELTYARDPNFGLQQAQNSYRNLSDVGAVVDPPGSPYWGEMYSQWIAQSLAEFHRVHPIAPDTLRAMLPAIAGDVRAWMREFDDDGDGLPARIAPRLTGYDLDILSFWYFYGNKLDLYAQLEGMERVDFASFVYANAKGTAELARSVGDTTLATEMDGVADTVRQAVLSKLWDDETSFFYPQRARDDARAPIRELHGFFPFTTGLAPDEARYTRALDKFIAEDEFWARYPPVITSLAHYREWTWEMDGLTRNIAPHPISMGARTLIEAFKHYPSGPVRRSHFMELLRRYNDLVYSGVHPNDPLWRPNAHEYFSKWEPGRSEERPKGSDISHDFHSAYNYLIVEGAVGLTPRADDWIELRPAAQEWEYFLLDRLRYRGHDLTIVWDRPDGQVRYADHPEGFSLYVDGRLRFTLPGLDDVRYDPQTDRTEVAHDHGPGHDH